MGAGRARQPPGCPPGADGDPPGRRPGRLRARAAGRSGSIGMTETDEEDGMAVTADLRQTRERIVREHMESENRHELDVTMRTFHHPRYELIASGDVYDGEAEVQRYFDETRSAFPDQRNEPIAL